MVRRKVTSASKHRLLFFGTVSIGIIVYFVFSVTYYTMNMYHLKKEEEQLHNNLSHLKYDEKLLKTEIEKLKDPEYLARYARENYLYSKNGEIVIKVQKEDNLEIPVTEEKNYTYLILGGCFVLSIVLGYVLKRSKKNDNRKRGN